MRRPFLALLSTILLTACVEPPKRARDKGKAATAADEKPAADAKKGSANKGQQDRKDIDLSAIKFDAPFDGKALTTKTLPGGLVIEDFVIGSGNTAKKGDDISVHYTGYLLDGSTFDSSIPRQRPITIPLGQGRVIKGWDRGLEGLKVGGKRRLTIPAALGYGSRAKGRIPADSDLVFTVELTKIAEPLPPPQPESAYAGEAKIEKRDNGLELHDYKEGSGPAAKKGDNVVVHYIGKLDDGTVFDSSHRKGRQPFKVPLGRGRVIKGWDQGLEGMKKGGLRKLVIPAELGYGPRAKGKIPADSRLTFFVELMEIAE